MYDSLLGKTIQYLDNINGNMINGTVVYMENIEINEEASALGIYNKLIYVSHVNKELNIHTDNRFDKSYYEIIQGHQIQSVV